MSLPRRSRERGSLSPPSWLVLAEFHLTVLAPAALRDADYRAVRRSLDSKRLHGRLRAAVRQVLRRDRSLLPVRVRLSR